MNRNAWINRPRSTVLDPAGFGNGRHGWGYAFDARALQRDPPAREPSMWELYLDAQGHAVRCFAEAARLKATPRPGGLPGLLHDAVLGRPTQDRLWIAGYMAQAEAVALLATAMWPLTPENPWHTREDFDPEDWR